MTRDLAHLLTTRRFLPLFITQALGATNDNIFKAALVTLITYRIAAEAGINAQITITLAAGLFILPFFLFSAIAGQLADKYEKGRIIRIVKFVEIVLMVLASIGFYWGDPYMLLVVLFLMGTQSSVFGPLKYSILPDHLATDELIGGNGLVEAGTFVAILVGTIVGTQLILADTGLLAVSAIVISVAAAGWAASLFIPKAGPAAPDLRVNPNIMTETWRIVGHARENRPVFLSILGISWFWFFGATYLSQFPTYAKDVLGANEDVVTIFLTVFAVGIAVGSLWCNRLLKGEINAKYVPIGALGMTLFSVDLFFASGQAVGAEGALIDGLAFLAHVENWRVLLDLFLISVCGGLYTVPLYAILQARSAEAERARTIAANNIVNALFMVVSAIGTIAMLAQDFTVTDVFLTIAVLNAGVAVYICKLLPQELLKAIAAALFRLVYRVEVKGLENYAKAGDKAVVVVNHVSFLDGPLLAALLPGLPTFAVDTNIAKRWWLKPFLALVDACPVDPTSPFSTKTLIRAVEAGRKCVIFPEGRITVTGALMKVYEGPGMIADKADAPIVPVRIDGAQYTPFSRLRGKLRLRWFPKITVTVMEPKRFTLDAGASGRQRRQIAGRKLQDEMARLIFETCDVDRTLFDALLEARAVHGGSKPVVEDVERQPMSYDRLVLGSLVLGRRLAALSAAGERVGVMLPNAAASVATFFALQAFGRVPAMLNFSVGPRSVGSACRTAELKTVVTSRRFVELGKLEPVIEKIKGHVAIVYLEDIRARIGLADKLYGLALRPFAGAQHRRHGSGPEDPAVVLFTSGSEGEPKGVVLSHRNLLANRYQLASVVDFNPTDTVFNALPIFHSFGLTGGMLLPLLSGLRTFMYPSPLHYRIVPELVYDTNATIMFGTDTFLSGYARMSHPYDFYSVRYVFAGAEKVKEETRRVWADKFGLRILEGYGATETAPVLATNTPMHFQAGTVGRLLPAIEARLEPVPGIDDGGRLVVRGPNVMLGYLKSDRPGVLQPPEGGWYDTGDVVEVDDRGFVRIVGRVKRFAKIGGEMVSLGAVETLANDLWQDHMHAAVAIPDSRKGEQLVLVSEHPEAAVNALLAHARAAGVPELMVPRTVLAVDRLPILGTGKVDYVSVRVLVDEQLG